MSVLLEKPTKAIKNRLLLDALNGENNSRPPVWLMRQAGRYMPSYQKIKQKYALLDMFQNEELITKITLSPIQELGVDAAILFSDILLPLQSFGFSLSYGAQGPQIDCGNVDIHALHEPSYDEIKETFSFVTSSIKNLKNELEVPLLGFSGAPFTLASYLLDHEKHHLLRKTKKRMYKDKEGFHLLLQKLTSVTTNFLKLQIEAGVDAIQIFDSWAGALDPLCYEEFTVKYLKQMIDALKSTNIPIILFSRGACQYVHELVKLGPSAISFDWQKELSKIKDEVPNHIAIQGNLDPDFLQSDFSAIRSRVLGLLGDMKGEKRYIFNLGHGLLPNTPYDSVKYLVDLVKSCS